MKKFLRSLIALSLAFGVLSLQSPAGANHHLVRISEVYLGTTGSTDAQFVELKAFADGQNLFDSNGAKVVFYEPDGDIAQTVTFSQNPDAGDSQDSILVATTAAESFFQVTADKEFTSTTTLSTGGKACFENSFDEIDCVSWGGFTGSGTGAGTPFKAGEGIPIGASILRDDGSDDQLSSADDTNNSKADFDSASPFPVSTAGSGGEALVRTTIGQHQYFVDEESSPATVQLSYPDAREVGFSIPFTTTPGSAEAGDFTDADTSVSFTPNDNFEDVDVPIIDNEVFEGRETIKVAIRTPPEGTVLGDIIDASIVINDNADDQDPPTSEIDRPKHGESYRAAKLGSAKGTSADGPGEIVSVKIGFRQKKKDGSCRWYDGDEFVRRACSKKKLLHRNPRPDGDWKFVTDFPMRKSVGTNIRFYTVFSAAVDEAGLVEDDFEKGRNANRFEIK